MSVIPSPRPLPLPGLALVLICSAAFSGIAFGGLKQVPMDFFAFWGAGRLNAAGSNPYDGARLLELQHEAGLGVEQAVVAWNPPWAVALFMPLGMVSPRTGFAFAYAFQLALILYSADRLWVIFAGRPQLRPVAWSLALLFAPVHAVLTEGQITPLALFGLAGFLEAKRRGRHVLAGVLGALAASKPHLLGLFAVALLLEGLRNRSGLKTLLGGATALAAASAIAIAFNPPIFSEYRDSVLGTSTEAHRAIPDWSPPVLGAILRKEFPGAPFAVQLLPLVVASLLFAAYWYRVRGDWNWNRAMPGIVFGSLVAAPYGGWNYDMVLLLVPFCDLAARFDGRRYRRHIAIGIAFFLLLNFLTDYWTRHRIESERYFVVMPIISAAFYFSLRPRPTTDGRGAHDSRILPTA